MQILRPSFRLSSIHPHVQVHGEFRSRLRSGWVLFALLFLVGVNPQSAFAQDSDLDGLDDAGDPCIADARNLCFGPVAIDGISGNPIRINTGADTAGECGGQKIDCNGALWTADYGYNQVASSVACNLAGGAEACVITGISPIFGCDDEETEDLFQCEHWDDTPAPELIYAFDVPDGDYVVNLFFGNTFTDTALVGERVFDITVNAALVYDDFDQVAIASGSGIAVVRSALVTTTGGAGITIELGHVIENPSLKAIEVLVNGPPECILDSECDDSNVCTNDTCNGGVCQNVDNTDSCDDGVACTSVDVCGNGVCAGVDSCSPGDVCNLGTGVCESAPVTEIRVNVNGAAHTGTDYPGAWAADAGECGPSTYTNAGGINNTVDDPLFQGEVYGNPVACSFGAGALAPSQYDVNLYFAEVYFGPGCPGAGTGTGARVFDIVLEGTTVLSNFDVFSEGGCAASTSDSTTVPIVKSYTIDIVDGTLDISLPATTNNGKISAVEIIESAPISCVVDPDCDDANACTNNTCVGGFCETAFNTDPCDDGIACTGSDVCSLGVCGGADTCTGGDVCNPTTGLCGVPSISFGKSTLTGASSSNPTTLQFGPDDRLYVGQQNGLIQIYDVVRNAQDDYSVTATESVSLVQSILNHDDDGSDRTDITTRQVTGLLVTGTPTNPILWVSSSDPRIGAGGSGTDSGLDTNSGVLSRLTWNGSSWDKFDIVRGLPRSEENHSANGMQLDTATQTMYLLIGGHTNQGAPSNNFALTAEYALSAAVLSIDLAAIGETTYDLPTLDDDDRAGAADANDPFGGNDGKNQAILVPGGPVQIHSPGFRNAFDLLITQAGRMYTVDNGPNGGWGDVPINEGVAGNCTNGVNEPGATHNDNLHFISGPGYYGGHPNPTRANTANTFNTTNPQSPVTAGNPIECDYRAPGSEDGALATWGSSTNGLAEYTASNFGGALQGDLLAASFSNQIQRIKLNAAGDTATLVESIFSSVGSTPLDVTTQPDAAPFPGTIWVANIGNGAITVYEPIDFFNCTGAYDAGIDEDVDGFDNADEIDNLTNPCSGADTPPDVDADFVSDLNDPDDDNDGLFDDVDPFAIDPDNGTTTQLPVVFTWNNNDPNPGNLLNLGWTGLMTNYLDDYLLLFDPGNMTAGGAAGVMTVDLVPAGNARAAVNTQEFGFQVGIDVSPATGIFTAHTRILGPFAGLTPDDSQSMGVFVGIGDQDNYVKLVLAANGGVGGVELAAEIAGVYASQPIVAETLPGPDYVDLYLEVDPTLSTVTASYEATTATVPGGIVVVGTPISIPANWTDGTAPIAAGVISTSEGAAAAFPVTWDSFQVTAQNPTSTAGAYLSMTPAGGINASTYGSGSFLLRNDSTDSQNITKLRLDLSTAFMPDMVFDPDGVAGDLTAKCFTADSGAVAVGLAVPPDPCLDPFQFAHDLGWDVIELDFTDFAPSETFTFSVDVDPTTIRGTTAPGPNDSGSVSGLELVGATVEVFFDDGSHHTNTAYRVGATDGGSESYAIEPLPSAPTLSILGIVSNPSLTTSAAQTARVTGTVGDDVALLVVEGGLFTAGLPGGGFDIDPFEANSAIVVAELTGVIGGSGFVDIPFTLSSTNVDGGINHIVAVAKDGSGVAGPASAGHVLQLVANICGDGVVEGTEACDDGGTVDGDCCSATCAFEAAASLCDDADACTVGDQCDGAGLCLPGAPVVCDDGLYCNGDETCDIVLGCQAGSPPDPDDLVDCTVDSCDEAGDQLLNTPDDLFCDDADTCTADSCDAISGCLNTPIQGCGVPVVPTTGEWGIWMLAVLMTALGCIWIERRRAPIAGA